MNREQAKQILRSYHLEGRDAEDPQFEEALQLLASDPGLAVWHAREHAIDQAISTAVRSFPVPPELKRDLLATSRVRPRRRWADRLRPALAVAAVLALLGAVAFCVVRSAAKPQFEDFRSYVMATAAGLDHLDVRTGDLGAINQWLSSHGAPADFPIPPKLRDKVRVGCRVFEWRGQSVSLVCFEMEPEKVAHLFIIDRAALADFLAAPRPVEVNRAGIATTAWSHANKVYILAFTRGSEDREDRSM